MARILCFFCLLFVLRSHAQDTSHVVTLKANSQDKQYKKVLIAGCGTARIRYFMESLVPALTAYYQKQGVTCVYEYIGTEQATLKAGVSAAVNNHQPDATLLMYQFDDKPDTLKRETMKTIPKYLIGGWVNEERRNVKNFNTHKNEEVKMAILEGINMMHVWQGQLKLINELPRTSLYEKICSLLTAELSKNRIPFSE